MILDTSVLIRIFKKGKTIRQVLFSYIRNDYYISIITYIEIMFGFAKLPIKKNEAYKQDFLKVLDQGFLQIIPIDTEVADTYVAIQNQCEQVGKKIGLFDGLIAATAKAKGMSLSTMDNDFNRVEGLKIISP